MMKITVTPHMRVCLAAIAENVRPGGSSAEEMVADAPLSSGLTESLAYRALNRLSGYGWVTNDRAEGVWRYSLTEAGQLAVDLFSRFP